VRRAQVSSEADAQVTLPRPEEDRPLPIEPALIESDSFNESRSCGGGDSCQVPSQREATCDAAEQDVQTTDRSGFRPARRAAKPYLGKFWSADGSVERHVNKVINLIGDGHLNAFELIYGASVPGEPAMPAPPDDSATECLVRSRA
jgi:hypothetical protein